MLNSYKLTGGCKPSTQVDNIISTAFDQAAENGEIPKIQYSYQIDEEKAKLQASNLKLEHILNLFIQFAPMKKSYHRFHEILLIDNSIKHVTAAQATTNA